VQKKKVQAQIEKRDAELRERQRIEHINLGVDPDTLEAKSSTEMVALN